MPVFLGGVWEKGGREERMSTVGSIFGSVLFGGEGVPTVMRPSYGRALPGLPV